MTHQTIQLTVEEGLAFQKFDARLQGFLDGVQATMNHVKQMRVQEILAARQVTAQAPGPTPTPDPTAE